MQTYDTTPFATILTTLGFTRDLLDYATYNEWMDDGEFGDVECEIWNLVLQASEQHDAEERQLTVQLWGDGKHRVSHQKHGQYDKKGWCSDGPPTSFLTSLEMVSAIHEQRFNGKAALEDATQ